MTSEPAGPAGLLAVEAAGQQGAPRMGDELGRARNWPVAAVGTGSKGGTGLRRSGERLWVAPPLCRRPSELRGWWAGEEAGLEECSTLE